MPSSGVLAAEDSLGHDVLVDWCLALLTGAAGGADRKTPSLRWIGGPAAGTDCDRHHWARSDLNYWPRVWAARALRYAWDDRAAGPVIAGLDDDAWRVREHCCAVVGLRELADAADRLAELTDPDQEDAPRVRTAAVKALAQVGEFEHGDALQRAMIDPDRKVRDAADAALERLAERIDRPLR